MSDKKGVSWLRWTGRLLWSYPCSAAATLARRIADDHRATVLTTTVCAYFVAVCLVTATGAKRGWWGRSLRTAWRNEVVARHNVAVADAALAEHERHQPEATDLRGLLSWRAQQETIIDRRSEEAGGVPSPWSPLGASQPWTRPTAFWAVVYHVHHFFTESYWPLLLATYLLVGIARETRRRRREARQMAGWRQIAAIQDARRAAVRPMPAPAPLTTCSRRPLAETAPSEQANGPGAGHSEPPSRLPTADDSPSQPPHWAEDPFGSLLGSTRGPGRMP
jgi:hypothetical protein